MLVRVLVTSMVTLSHEVRVDGVLTDAAGDVTVTVRRLDGELAVSPFVATHVGVGRYTAGMPAWPELDTLTVDWSGSVAGATVVTRDVVEVVGGFLFGLDQARVTLRLPTTLTTETLAARRIEVETTAEDVASLDGCRGAFVPRFRRVALNGTGTAGLLCPFVGIRAVRAVTVDGQVFTAGQLADCTPTDAGVIWLASGVWPAGHANVLVEFEYGMDAAPPAVSEVALQHLRAVLARPASGIPDRAISYAVANGGTYRLTVPSVESTGLPEVDAVYHRYGVGSPV